MAQTDDSKNIYQTRSVTIKSKDEPFAYCDQVTALTNNLENTVLFRVRQVMFAVSKDPSGLTENERKVMEEIRDALPKMGSKFKMPSKGKFFLSYEFLEKLMSVTDNPDMYAEGLSRHTAQNAVKSVVRNMKSYFEAIRAWKKDKSSFTGKPELMDYHRKGGHCTATISNQEAILKDIDGGWYLKLPYRKDQNQWIPFGKVMPRVRLKQVTIKPENGVYIVTIVLQSEAEKPALKEEPERIAAIDTGVDNLMAVTNNCGLQSILYKGNICKSINQWYNKQAARMVSEQTLKTGKKFVPTAEYHYLTRKRNNRIKDFMLKTAKHFVQWCVENRIDTVVMGCNPGWKQEIEIGDSNNQNFVQIPFDLLRSIISYLCERVGIRYVEQEESYTSKASFVDGDYIPVYGVDDEKANFSGKRRPTRYRGMYRKDGFRGLYRTKDGTIINSDLNGSANILRKAFPNAFKKGVIPDFGMPLIFRHPDMIVDAINRTVQKVFRPIPSKSKLKRIVKKLTNNTGNPVGIELCG
ncbi:MAG: IS200/IS605 family accessory protein TnpB-related protein [Anaerolineaceae bacterium]|nr:IS200/IS605 family accessory protein TnpB-related protein [Anaerolineaceae bacterium]